MNNIRKNNFINDFSKKTKYVEKNNIIKNVKIKTRNKFYL